ncbi:MAG: MoxR family ATPase [Planctomycetota bacterium]
MSDEQPNASSDPETLIADIRQASDALSEQIGKAIVGQQDVVEQVFLALFTRGHALLVGVPGLAKTLLVSTIAKSLSLEFNRIQFTPDLMPSDITGTEVIEENRTTGHREMRFVKGPVFANLILADEINRTPPKTQAALLEAMQEHHVTAGGIRHPLPDPFFVLATQNPIEQEGTYPLPEAQLDRFMFMIRVGYPTQAEELEVIRRTTCRDKPDVQPVLTAEKVTAIQEMVRDVPVADHVIEYALRLVRATRRPDKNATDERPDFMQNYLRWGAGPRASQYLILAAKAKAVLGGRTHVHPDDVKSVARPVLRHRILTNFNAEADGVTADDLIDRLLDHIQVTNDADPQAAAVLK